METFIWSPRLEPRGSSNFRALSAKFGDGYEQTAEDGMNNCVQSWLLEFVRIEPEAKQIIAFFLRHKGVKAFRWTPPLSDPGYYKVTSFQHTPMGAGNHKITATFEQTFKP